MPRPLRLHVPGAMYHVTLRGNHRQNIFFPKDRQILSDLIAEVTERFGARVHAYCYMTNHLHALIQVGDIPLGRLMLRIGGILARVVALPYAWTKDTDFCILRGMKTTLDIDDGLLAKAKALSARERKSVTTLIEEGLRLRLRIRRHKTSPSRPSVPVYRGRSGLATGIDPASNRSMLDAAGDDA